MSEVFIAQSLGSHFSTAARPSIVAESTEWKLIPMVWEGRAFFLAVLHPDPGKGMSKGCC